MLQFVRDTVRLFLTFDAFFHNLLPRNQLRVRHFMHHHQVGMLCSTGQPPSTTRSPDTYLTYVYLMLKHGVHPLREPRNDA